MATSTLSLATWILLLNVTSQLLAPRDSFTREDVSEKSQLASVSETVFIAHTDNCVSSFEPRNHIQEHGLS